MGNHGLGICSRRDRRYRCRAVDQFAKHHRDHDSAACDGDACNGDAAPAWGAEHDRAAEDDRCNGNTVDSTKTTYGNTNGPDRRRTG